MNLLLKKKIGLLAIVTVMLLSLAGCSDKKPETALDESTENVTASENTAETGTDEHAPEAAPLFTLEDLQGNAVSLEGFKGQYVMVNFWATWCKYCDEEMPDLMAFQEKYKDELKIIAIDVNEDKATVQKYVDKKQIDLTVLLDSDGSIAQEYMVSAFPTTFLIDKSGKIIGFIPGKMTLKDMEASFQYLKDNASKE